MTWGMKASWRTYTAADSVWDDTVSVNGAGEYQWPLSAGEYDAATGTTTLAFDGAVHWRGHWYPKEAHLFDPPAGWQGSTELYVLDVLLEDPEVTIGPDGSTLTAEVVARHAGTWEVVDHGRIVMADLDVSGLTPTLADGAVTWSGIPSALPDYPAREVFGNQYRAGQTLDPVSLTYVGEGGAPDLSESWDEPGSAAVTRGGSAVLVKDVQKVWQKPLWEDPERGIVHSRWSDETDTSYAQALDLRSMQPLGEPVVVPGRAGNAPYVVDREQQRIWFASASGATAPVDSYLAWDPAAQTYRTGTLAVPVTRRPNQTIAVWDEQRRRLLTVNREVPGGVASSAFEQHLWFLNVLTPQDDGSLAEQRFPLPAAAESRANRFAYAPTNVPFTDGAAEVAADGSLLFKQTAYTPTGSTTAVATPVRRITLVDGAAQVTDLPGSASTQAVGVLTSPQGHIALATQGSLYFDDIRSTVRSYGLTDTGAIEPLGDWVDLAPRLIDDYEIDPADGSVWGQTASTQRLVLVRDGRVVLDRRDDLLSARSAGLVVPGDGTVWAQGSDGEAYTWDTPYGHGYVGFTLDGIVPTPTTQPAPRTVRIGTAGGTATATFTAEAIGTPAPTTRWQVKAPGSSRFVDVPGGTGATLEVVAGAAHQGSVYRAVHTNAAGSVASTEAVLTVESAPVVAAPPASVVATAGSPARFSVLTTGHPEPTVTWQRRVGGFWTDVAPDDDVHVESAEGSSTLTVLATEVEQSGAQFRARAVNSAGTTTTRTATLTVTPAVEVPEEGLDLEGVVLDWSGSAELQARPPFGTSSYFSAGVSDGKPATYAASSGDVEILHVAADGSEAAATWETRAAQTSGDVTQVARLGGGVAELEADGAAVVRWDGAWSVNFYDGLVPFTLTDPVLTVAADGTGALTADISGYASSASDPGTRTPLEPVADVTVATFSGVEIDPAGTVEVVPDYAGVEVVTPADHAAQDRTVDGWGSWPQGFVDVHGRTGLASYWYSSGGAADPRKPAAPFTVDLTDAEPVDGPGEAVAPTITRQPVDVGVRAGQDATFAVAADGVPAPTVRWQVRSNGGAWHDVAGADSPTLVLRAVSVADSGTRYRAVATNAAGAVTSAEAILTVTPVAPAPGSVAVGSTVRWDPLAAYGTVGRAKGFSLWLAGHDGKRVHGTVFVTARLVGTSRVLARAWTYEGRTTRMATPVLPARGNWQVRIVFVPSDPAYRTVTRSRSLWVTTTGR
nr:HtaA domain-containing protein [Nocardioides zeae]